MNEDKEKFIKEYQAKFEIHPGDLGVIADFWLNKMQESNKALLTKLRGEIEINRSEMEDHECPGTICPHYPRTDAWNNSKDQDIALIDKYLEQ